MPGTERLKEIMAVIKPFAALRPAPALAAQTAALPYDVYSREEARCAVAGNPLSFLNIDRPETQFPPESDMYADCVYEKAKELLHARIADGTYIREEKPCYYIYALTMNGRTQTGIVGCSSIDDYVSGVIKKHENTRLEKELDRIRHVDTCSAQTGPIFLACRSIDALRAVTKQETAKEPLFDFTSEDNIRHTVWRIMEENTIEELRKALSDLPATYIADGHHRAASAVKVGLRRRAENPHHTGNEEYNFFLSVLFPDDQLLIMPYNRVVKDLNGLDKMTFLQAVSRSFLITPAGSSPVQPERKGCFGMFLEDSWYLLEAKPEIQSSDPIRGLDVSVLQDHLLTPILGIQDPRTDERIAFIGGIRGLSELERRVRLDMKIAFSMHPTSIGELFAVADAGLLMPPKSTWFEPKLRSGIFIHEF